MPIKPPVPESMVYEKRKPLMERIEALRQGRALICFFNFDRTSLPGIGGISTQFHAEVKEALFRVLKESTKAGNKGVDLCLYTRGGDTNSVWPIVGILREFDPDFQVLVPFRCHSSGTLLALGAKSIFLGPMSELSPIDPSTGNQFNPIDPTNPQDRLAISVEDVQQYLTFAADQLREKSGAEDLAPQDVAQFLEKLVLQVHPLAIGNVHRVYRQIKKLAENLLALHPVPSRKNGEAVDALTTSFYSHLHMINRHEAVKILGEEHVKFATDDLAVAMDDLLRAYEDRFELRRPYVLGADLGDKLQEDARFIGGAVESRHWSYLFETKARVRQHSKIPPNVQVQVPVGQGIPLIPGLARDYVIEVMAQGWVHNKEPLGVTV